MAIDTMKKGSIEMLTLFLLCEEDAYGYQLVQKIKERSKGFITVQEGRFHQVKRMAEAVGRKVEYLKRISMGPLVLDKELKKGEYRPLFEEELAKLKESTASK